MVISRPCSLPCPRSLHFNIIVILLYLGGCSQSIVWLLLFENSIALCCYFILHWLTVTALQRIIQWLVIVIWLYFVLSKCQVVIFQEHCPSGQAEAAWMNMHSFVYYIVVNIDLIIAHFSEFKVMCLQCLFLVILH